jgi:hypothetical protein
MRCHEVRNRTSEYIDHFVEEPERRRYIDHVAECASCREHLEATRSVVASLRAMPAPAVPFGLAERTLMAIDREAEPEVSIVTRRHMHLAPHYHGSLLDIARQLFVDYEFKLVAYSVGLCLSFVMFGSLLLSLRPILSISPFEPPSERAVWITPMEGALLSNHAVPVAYSLPRISDGNALVDYARFGTGDLVVIAEVSTDGRGQVVEVLSGPHDERAVGELSIALNRPRTFVPAFAVSGRPVASRVVLFVEQVDIIG